MMMLKMMNPMGSMPVIDCSIKCDFTLTFPFQSVPGTGDDKDKEDSGLTREELKEQERLRFIYVFIEVNCIRKGLKKERK